MIDCPCGSILFPKGSKYDQEGLSIQIVHDTGVLNLNLVHDKEALLSGGQSFITSTPKINIDQTLNIKQIIIKCGSKFDLILKNIASAMVRINDSFTPISYELFGELNRTHSFKTRDGSNEISIKLEDIYSHNLLDKKVVIEFYSICDDLTDNCCDKLPSTLDIVPSSISYAPCFTTTTSTTTSTTSTTTTLYPPCQNINLPDQFTYIAVGYGSLFGQEIEAQATRSGNTWNSNGTFPCGASFSLQMTCDVNSGKFVYDGQIDCCDQSTKYVAEPSDLPYLSPNTRTPLIIAYTRCSCNPSCSTSTSTTTTPPPISCATNTPISIDGYAFYASSNTPKNVPGVGMINPPCFGGHKCDKANFIPELKTTSATFQAPSISLNNANDGGDRVANFSFSLPDASILKGGASFDLRCANNDCHQNPTWIVLTTTIDGQTVVLLNTCLIANSNSNSITNQNADLTYKCKDCCQWDGNGFIQFGENCVAKNQKIPLQFVSIGENLWESQGFNQCGDFVHAIVSCDPNIEPPFDATSCQRKWKVVFFDVPCAVNPRMTNQITELCTCNLPPVWLWTADDLSACKCCNCAVANVIVDGMNANKTSTGLMVDIGDFITTSSSGRIIYDTVTNRFLDAPANLAIFVGNTRISLGDDLSNYQSSVQGELQFLYPDNPYFDNSGFYAVEALVCGNNNNPLPPKPPLPQPPQQTTLPPNGTTTTAAPINPTSIEITKQPSNYMCPYGQIYGCVSFFTIQIRLKNNGQIISNNTLPITYTWEVYNAKNGLRTMSYTTTDTSNSVSIDTTTRLPNNVYTTVTCTVTVAGLTIRSQTATAVGGAIA